MWLSVATLVAGAFAAVFASDHATVYTLESNPRSDHLAPSISSENARLWLANRLGLSSFLDLNQADMNTISLLNQYGDGHQATLFAPTEPKSRKLVIIEGVDHPDGSKSFSFPKIMKLTLYRILQGRVHPNILHLEPTIAMVKCEICRRPVRTGCNPPRK